MELPDCPPGAEGYQDTVVEMPKKTGEETTCTKAEQEFQEHLNSLKIRLDNGETRCMVERRGRDISGKWIYLCYPCGSVCSGESILQTHISGKKHKVKLSMKTTWPVRIFDDHPFNQNQKIGAPGVSTATEKVLEKMAAAVEVHKQGPTDLEQRYNKYREATCHIQEDLNNIKAPLVGLEYLIEFPPEQSHHEPSYICTLCTKQGHPRTIINHMTCFWHRYNYLIRHFPKATSLLAPYRNLPKYREGVNIIMHRLTQRVADTFGRMKPVNIDKEEYDKNKDPILQWIFKGHHFSEHSGATFEEVVDAGLIENLAVTKDSKSSKKADLAPIERKRDPSPPIVAAPSRPLYVSRHARREKRVSIDSLSDISDDDVKRPKAKTITAAERAYNRDRMDAKPERRNEPYADQRREIENFRSKYTREIRDREDKVVKPVPKTREPYKVKLAEEKRQAVEDSAAQMLAYHEKNPEKHPLYPDEWKKFWNRRYKEIQAEGKDPSKHDFKPEWIVFWTKRMKELHEEELHMQVSEIYRRMNLPLPDLKGEEPRRSPGRHDRKMSPERRRSPDRRRSPAWNVRRSPDPRRRSPDSRRRSPEPRERSVDLRRKLSPRPEYRPAKRVPDPRYSIDRRNAPLDARPSPPKRSRSRSPRRLSLRLDEGGAADARRSRSPLAQRELSLRNRSPLSRRAPDLRNRSPGGPRRANVAPSLQTVMISDDELKPDDLSPWNSDNDIESLNSMPRSARAPSHASSRAPYHSRGLETDLGPPENIVATLRVLVALEDYLGSLGPKIVDLLTDALKMEKESANSSEELLEREEAVVLIETAKEKLKGAAQAGLVPAAAAPALRAAVLRAAATLHEADTRARRHSRDKKLQNATKPAGATEAVPVAGVGSVNRAEIAQQMAAALIAQGKTNVTSEELAQLVDAVVGMAEAKKREAEAARKVEVSRAAPPPVRPAKKSGTATALQMLQSAYDENDKKVEKDEAIDAMDGLSDSDLETLLKNFNELSAEEQHSLIAYLKKLEAREPQRVERLRKYVSAAAAVAPPGADEPQPPPTDIETKTVTIMSDDDDDYAVEEVFQSATQKVKEDQIRKELDIVKKSLEESKEEETVPPPPVKALPIAELSQQISSATDLFALVQASIKSTSVAPVSNIQTIAVVASSTQPRSFGDVSEVQTESSSKPQNLPNIPVLTTPIANMQRPDHELQTQFNNDNFDVDDTYGQAVQWDKTQMDDDTSDNRDLPMEDQQYNDYNQGDSNVNNSGQEQYAPAPNSGPNQFDQGQFNVNSGPNQYGQGNNNRVFDQRQTSGFNQGPSSGYGPVPNSGFAQGPNGGLGQNPNSGFGQAANSGFSQGPNSGFGQGPNPGNPGFIEGPNSSGGNQFSQHPGSYQYGQGPRPNQFGSGQNVPWQGNSGSNQWQGHNNYQPNQGLRDNFMNGGRVDNLGVRPPQYDNGNQQQFGNFRGRGGVRGRGRGRGRY